MGSTEHGAGSIKRGRARRAPEIRRWVGRSGGAHGAGERPRLSPPFPVTIVDDDVGGPYSIAPRDVFAKTLGVTPGRRPGVSRVILVYSEPRSWKGRGDLGERSVAQLERLVPGAEVIVLFGHPRLAAQIPGDAPILCAWHGQALMQRAAARLV